MGLLGGKRDGTGGDRKAEGEEENVLRLLKKNMYIYMCLCVRER